MKETKKKKKKKDGMTWKKQDNNGTTCPECQTRLHFNRLRDAISDIDAFFIDTDRDARYYLRDKPSVPDTDAFYRHRDAISDRDAFFTDTDRDAISEKNAILTDTAKKQDNNGAT